MKKIGLVGGLGPASTVAYYQGLMDISHREKGADFYPEIVIDSVNMTAHMEAFAKKDYDGLGALLLKSLENLKAAGAQLAAVTANTEHIVWDRVCDRFPLPVVSITQAAISALQRENLHRVAVFGTEYTLKSGLYEKALLSGGLTPIIPTPEDAEKIGRLIFPNLENGIVISEDKAQLLHLAEKYISEFSADALLLGCTELPLAIKAGEVSVPVVDTTAEHIRAIFTQANA